MSDSPIPAQSLPDLTAAPRARLFTTWGTVLYVDIESGELRHGPIDSSPANALFVADPEAPEARHQGWLMHDTGDGLVPIVCLTDNSWSCASAMMATPPATPTRFELVPLERGLLGLRSGSRYLSAEGGNQLTLSKPWCSSWEYFLASEDWCTPPLGPDGNPARADPNLNINWRGVAGYIVEPMLRARSRRTSAMKILIFGHSQWSHGRVYYDVCKALSDRGYVIDLLDWTVGQGWKIEKLLSYYDFVIAALNGIETLVDIYRVPCERIIALSHHEMDMQMLLNAKGAEIFEQFAGYGVVGYQLFDASAILGIARPPLVVPLGVNVSEFYAELPERLTTVGYAGSISHKTLNGIEWKRGELAEAAAREAGLEFKVAGSVGAAISFHDMPGFYKSVDTVLVSSLSEGAGLPFREAAAAGRLVISTPVGDFPLRAAQGIGVVAPIEGHKYEAFVTATLAHYKEHPAEFAEICRKSQEAARQLDWTLLIRDWIELIDSATQTTNNRAQRDLDYVPQQQERPMAHQPRLTICCSAYKRPGPINVLVHCLMCQTLADFKLMILHDGEDSAMQGLLSALKAQFPDRLEYRFTPLRYNDWGYSLHQMILDECVTQYIMFTNDDDYYVPHFLEYMFSKIEESNLDLVLCDMVHSFSGFHEFITEPRKLRVDIGCFIIRTEIAKSVGFMDKSFEADGSFIDDVMSRYEGKLRWGKVDKLLFVHT
jgi:glycosyltransferase involved in cell wall biosynthesis